MYIIYVPSFKFEKSIQKYSLNKLQLQTERTFQWYRQLNNAGIIYLQELNIPEPNHKFQHTQLGILAPIYQLQIKMSMHDRHIYRGYAEMKQFLPDMSFYLDVSLKGRPQLWSDHGNSKIGFKIRMLLYPVHKHFAIK